MVSLDDPRARELYAEPEDLPRMSFGDHLDELRRRLIKSLLAMGVCVFVLLFCKETVQGIIIEPYRMLWRSGFVDYVAELEQRSAAGELTHPQLVEMLEFCRQNQASILDGSDPREIVHTLPVRTGFKLPYELVSIGGVEDFWMFMMASLVFALVISAPVVIWQAWAFVAAGLYQSERRVFLRFFPFAMGLLITGVLFGYFLALPVGLGYLIRLMVDGLVSSMLTVGNYFTFLFAVTAAMGLVFQLPIIMLALQRVGIARHETFVRKWRVFVLVICVLSAFLTPPDPVSLAFMATPTLLLYGIGLVLTWFGRKHEADLDAQQDQVAGAGA